MHVVPTQGIAFVPSINDTRERVLVVDDEAAIRELIRTVLNDDDPQTNHPGFCVGTAGDGEAALSMINNNWGPDLVLMDLMMPRLVGSVAIERIKTNPRTKHIPVIAMSAGSTLRKSQIPLADALLAKPFDIDTLLAQVRFWIRRTTDDRVVP